MRPLGNECCVGEGDDHGEAYTVIIWGVGLSHEILEVAGAEAVATAEGNMCGAATQGTVALPGSEATSRMNVPQPNPANRKVVRVYLDASLQRPQPQRRPLRQSGPVRRNPMPSTQRSSAGHT